MFTNAPLCLEPICPPNDPSEPHNKCSVLGLASVCTYFIVQLVPWVFKLKMYRQYGCPKCLLNHRTAKWLVTWLGDDLVTQPADMFITIHNL